MKRKLGIVVLLLALISFGFPAQGAEPLTGRSIPVAMAWVSREQLVVALRDSREIVLVDASQRKILARWPLKFRPHSVSVNPESGDVIVGGFVGELAILKKDGSLRSENRAGRGPVTVLALDGSRIAVAPLWDHRVDIVDAQDGHSLSRHELDFSPGSLCKVAPDRLFVGDAFGSRIADLQTLASAEVTTREIEGVNLRGLAVSADGRELLVAHTNQDSAGPIHKTNIDWGLVISSKLTAFRIRDFTSSKPELNFRRLTLDGSRNGASDPSAIAVSPDGLTMVVALSGAHRLLKVDRRAGPKPAEDLLPLGNSLGIVDCEVGDSPRSVLIDAEGTFAVSADSMSDSLTFVDLASFQKFATVAVGLTEARPTAEQRGEAAFHDGRLALDRWMTCASCHPSGHTTGLNFDTLGDGDQGRPKNTPSLLGVRDTAPYAWTGRFPLLKDQVRSSIETSQHGGSASDATVADMVAYLSSLEAPPPRRSAEEPAVRRGAATFETRKCTTCHVPPTFTSRSLRDVGFADGLDATRRYNPPSLRGVGRTAPYLHDGRATSLADLLKVHHPHFDEPPSDADRADLQSYLESL